MNKKGMYKKEKRINHAICILMILMVMVTVFSLIFLLMGSFMSDEEINSAYGMIKDGNDMMKFASFHLIPHDFSLSQYSQTLWDSSDFWFYFWNSMFYSIPILAGTIIISILGGYAFAKFNFPFRRFWLVIFIIVMMIPYQVMLSPTLIIMNNIGLLNTRISIILPNIFTPFGTYLIYQFMCSIPDETIEAAKVDGAGSIMILRRIVLPQVKGGIASLAILNIIDTWNLVEQPVMFLKNEFRYPLSAALSYFQSQDAGTSFVCGVTFVLPLILLFLIGKEYLIDGIRNSVVGTQSKGRGN